VVISVPWCDANAVIVGGLLFSWLKIVLLMSLMPVGKKIAIVMVVFGVHVFGFNIFIYSYFAFIHN